MKQVYMQSLQPVYQQLSCSKSLSVLFSYGENFQLGIQ